MYSPQRDAVSKAQPVWDDAWLRELTIEEALVEAQLDGADMGELLGVTEDETWPPEELVASMEAQSRATSPSRSAAVVKWLGSAFEGMVLTKHVVRMVMGERQTVETKFMESVRDGLIEVFPWAHNVTICDDYVWPEVGQQHESIVLLSEWVRQLVGACFL